MGYFAFHSFLQPFPHIFQGSVRNKVISKFSTIACRRVAFATHSTFIDEVQVISLGMKPLAIGSSLYCTVVRFLHTLCTFISAMLHFLTPKPKTDEHHEKISAMSQHLKANAGARRETHRAPYIQKHGLIGMTINDQELTATLLGNTPLVTHQQQ